MSVLVKSPAEIRTARRREPHAYSNLVIACLWPKKGENLGTTLRTCDAVNARMVVPRDANARQAIVRGNTIGLHNSPVDFVDDPMRWLLAVPNYVRIVGVELAHGAIPLVDLAPAFDDTLVLVGHEATGIPPLALAACDEVVEIPMEGVGNSLNVSVAAALVLYKLRGWT